MQADALGLRVMRHARARRITRREKGWQADACRIITHAAQSSSLASACGSKVGKLTLAYWSARGLTL